MRLLPMKHAGSAHEILATPGPGGTTLTDYDAAGGPIDEYTAVIPNK